MGVLKKRGIALILSVCALAGLTACTPSIVESSRSSGTVFVPEFLEFDLAELGIEYISGGYCDGKNAYVLAEAGQEVEQTDPDTGDTWMSYEYRTSIFRFPLEGGEAAELADYVPSNEDEETAPGRESYFNIESITIGGDGNLWVTETVEEYIYDVPEDFDPSSDYVWNYEMLGNETRTVRRALDETGKEITRIDATGLREALGITDSNGYIGSSVQDNDGNFFVFAEVYRDDSYASKLAVLDSTLAPLFEIDLGNSWGNLVLLGDGTVAMSCYVYDQLTGSGGQKLRTVDLKKQDWGTEYPMPVNVGNVYTGSGQYLFYYDNGDSLYGYDAKTEEGKKLLNWSSSDINSSNLSFFTFLEDGRVAAMTTTWGDYGMEAELVLLTERDASVLENKTVLTYATMSLDYDTRERIIDFNKRQNDYRIEIRDYSEFNTADDYNAGLTKLSTEIIAGQVPDILDTSGLPIRQYGAKGLLEDLWPYIEADEEIGGRAGLMENVLRAAEQEGALYQIFDSFTVRTAVGASAVVGEDLTWTMEELNAALAAMPEGCTIFSEGDTKDSMLSNILAMQLDNFVDWSTGECHFDSPDFVALLEFCNSFPLTYDWSKVDWEEYEDENTRISNGMQLLSASYLYDFQDIQTQKFLFGGDITYVGYPREDGGVGSSFAINSGMAMSTTCKDKEGAWTFMRDVLLPESREDEEYFYFSGWGFPVNRQDFDVLARRYMTPRYILDENGDPMLDENGDPIEESQGGIGWGNGTYMELYATTQEEYDQIMDLINSIDSIYTYDTSIYSIVSDVAKRCFNGDITVEAAADQIQSRVKLYVNENL